MIKKNQALIGIFVFVFFLLYMRLIQIQIAEYKKYNTHAKENAAKTVSEPAPRGVIYDRNGKVLVESKPVFLVRVLPYVLATKTPAEQKRILNKLNELLGEEVEIKVTATEPFIVKDKIPLETAIRIKENIRDLEGVVVTSRPVRLSRYGNVAAHVLGYVGEIEARELTYLREAGYRMGDIIGKDGVEKTYDKYIRGVDGGKRVEVDVYGKPTRILESLDPKPGPDLKLTIDLNLQMAAEKALGQREGAVVVMSAKTGEILALASYPNYDPNIFSDPLKKVNWQEISSKKHPFINRALAIYPPGSVFKIITLAAALEEGVTTPDEIFDCKGYYRIHRRIAKCWLGGGHGPITVKEGLVWSCDIVFYELARRLGPDLIAKYAHKFGLGTRTGIDLPQEKRGNVPTKEWKEKYLREPWYNGDSINYGIGQGFVQVTPIQMATIYAALASGKVYKPYIVKEVKNREGKIIYSGSAEVVSELSLKLQNLKLIKEALIDVVDRGTGVAVRFSNVPAAGKTGTAENRGVAHAWFVCYAPLNNPEIVVAAFVAHGGHGDKISAYVARDVLKWYKENRLKKDYDIAPYQGQYILQRGRFKVPYGRPKTPKPQPSGEVENLGLHNN